MGDEHRIDSAEVKSLVERKLEIAAQVRLLRAEGARLNQELFRLGAGDPQVTTIIAAW